MLNLEDLSQLVAFYQYGTLTKVAEEFHISQPTITRTMKRIEEEFGISLFSRTGNHIEFNEVGKKAVEYATDLLHQAEQCHSNVVEYDRHLRSLSIISCAPAPLWDIIPILSREYPDKTISSKLTSDLDGIEKALRVHKYDYAILPHPIKDDNFICSFFEEEHLFISVPLNHALAKYTEVTAKQINGYNCLLSPEIGFWSNFCGTNLPNSKFLVQQDDFSFRELIKESTLPCFTTNLATGGVAEIKNRINIPITDADAHVKFYLIEHNH